MSHADKSRALFDYRDILGAVFLMWDRWPNVWSRREVKLNAARAFRTYWQTRRAA